MNHQVLLIKINQSGDNSYLLLYTRTIFLPLILPENECNYHLIDCQVETNHLLSMGAQNISRQEYLMLLQQHISETGGINT